MAFKDIKKVLCEEEGFVPTEIPEFEDAIEEVDAIETSTEVSDCDIYLASKVKVIDIEGLVPADHDMDEDALTNLQAKVDAGTKAIVFDEIEEDESLVSIIFEDGLEVFRIEKSRLQCCDDDEEEDDVTVTPVDTVPEEDIEIGEDI